MATDKARCAQGDDDRCCRLAVSAVYFSLAFAAVLNLKLLAIDLLLTENRRRGRCSYASYSAA